MHYKLIADLIEMVRMYDEQRVADEPNLPQFASWLHHYANKNDENPVREPDWAGKANGRSADSVINTTLVHLYRYAKIQAKSAIIDTPFSTPDDFIYLISLTSFGSMSKTALIKLNVHEKSAGMQIINRLINNGLVAQEPDDIDKRNRLIHITPAGIELLKNTMQQIKKASSNVTEPLSHQEKMELIRLLTKLEDFHELKARVKVN